MWLDTVMKPAKDRYRSLGIRDIPPVRNVPIDGVVFMELWLEGVGGGRICPEARLVTISKGPVWPIVICRSLLKGATDGQTKT